MKLWDNEANKIRPQFYKIMAETIGLTPQKMSEAISQWLHIHDGTTFAAYTLAWSMASPFIKKSLGLEPEPHVKWCYAEFLLSSCDS